MKNAAALILALALPAITFGEDGGRPRPPREGNSQAPVNRDGAPEGGPRRPVPPLIAALDANHDGLIDEQEIANAPAALRALDKNGDGKLTMDELRPPRPDGDGPQGPGSRDGAPRFAPRDDQNVPPANGTNRPRRDPRPPEDR